MNKPARSEEKPALERKHVNALIWSTFVGLLIYGLLYAGAEYLVYIYGNRNPFYEIVTYEGTEPALIVLGASHALPLEYNDMNQQIEQRVGGPVLNLAVTGGGVVPNVVFFDTYLAEHGADQVRAVLYVLDSFAFYSPQWNEERMTDVELWQRAPLDKDVARQVVASTLTFDLPATIPLMYLSGFPKLNDPSTWFAPDVWDAESEFETSYDPSDFQDRERISFLYPEEVDQAVTVRYLAHFVDLVQRLDEFDIPLVVVKPPLRSGFYEQLPSEDRFDDQISAALEPFGVPLYDFSRADYPAEFFYDPDHLNRRGVLHFLDNELGTVIQEQLR